MGRVRLTGVLAIAMVFAVAGIALGAKLVNGNFEKGNFSGWDTKSSDAAKWKIYDKDHRVTTTPSKIAPDIKLPKPIGKFSPFIDMVDQSNGFLSREIKIPTDAKSLTLKAFWINEGDHWVQQGTFIDPGADDQYFSIDLIKPDANPSTSSKADILENIHAPVLDPVVMPRGSVPTPYVSDGWKGFKANVKKYRGDKVVLRVAEISMNDFNYVGIDNVKVK